MGYCEGYFFLLSFLKLKFPNWGIKYVAKQVSSFFISAFWNIFSCVKAIHKVGFIPEYLVNKLIFLLYSEVIPIFLCFNFRHNIFVSDCIEKQKKQIMLENLGGRCVIPASGKTGELILWQACSFSLHTNNSIYIITENISIYSVKQVRTFEFMELLEKTIFSGSIFEEGTGSPPTILPFCVSIFCMLVCLHVLKNSLWL